MSKTCQNLAFTHPIVVLKVGLYVRAPNFGKGNLLTARRTPHVLKNGCNLSASSKVLYAVRTNNTGGR